MLAMVRGRSQPFAYTLRLQGVPVRLANASEPDRTPSVAIVAIVSAATNLGTKAGLGEFLRHPLTRLLGQARVDLRCTRGFACRARIDASGSVRPCFSASCSLRDMGTHVCALPTGEHCPRGLVCLGCNHAQPKKSALPTFRRMLASHLRALERAREHGEPAGQIAARELQIERIRSAMERAEELMTDVAAALEAA
jgi:hypothetical protein